MERNDDKRKFIRIPAAAIVEIAPFTPNQDQENVSVETIDISVGGVQFASDRSYQKGSLWNFTLLLHESLRRNPDWKVETVAGFALPTIKALCEIVRTKGSEEIGYDIAARFVHIEESDAAALEKFLSGL